MDIVIETNNLTKRFKATMAVDGLNLAVKRGEIFGLVGPDGAGKTTTICSWSLKFRAGSAGHLRSDVIEEE